MERESYPPGTPSWIDLGTPDVDAAAGFYAALFGWDIAPAAPEAGGYRIAVLRGRPVAGLGPQNNPGPPWWTTYVSVASCDETAAKVTAAGGTILAPPMDVFAFGRMAVCLDSSGAAFALWEPREHIGAGIRDEPGTLCWNELAVRDLEPAKAFYGEVFGWTGTTDPAMAHSYTTFTLDGATVAGCMLMTDEWPAEVPNHWMVYFATDDCDAAVAMIAERGGSVTVPPTDIPPGRFAVVSDPQGAMFSLLQMREPVFG